MARPEECNYGLAAESCLVKAEFGLGVFLVAFPGSSDQRIEIQNSSVIQDTLCPISVEDLAVASLQK
jgi:hypothetical protein